MYFIAMFSAQPLHLMVDHCFYMLMKERLGRLDLNMIVTWSIDLKKMAIRTINADHPFISLTNLQGFAQLSQAKVGGSGYDSNEGDRPQTKRTTLIKLQSIGCYVT